MRWLGGALLLVGLLYLACEVETAAEAVGRPVRQQTNESDWRRTADGWQRRSSWQRPEPYRPVAPHPLVVGLFELFLVVLVLAAAAPDRPAKAALASPPARDES